VNRSGFHEWCSQEHIPYSEDQNCYSHGPAPARGHLHGEIAAGIAQYYEGVSNQEPVVEHLTILAFLRSRATAGA
jgi:hypothetical protein